MAIFDKVCASEAALADYDLLAAQGMGYKRIWQLLKWKGHDVGKHQVWRHSFHVRNGFPVATGTDASFHYVEDPLEERDSLTAIDEYVEHAHVVDPLWYAKHGIALPPDFRGATVEVRGPDGQRHWVRTKPDLPEDERIEIRQAEPVTVQCGHSSGPTLIAKGNWYTAMISPDAQIGYWQDSKGNLHTIHDERCFDVGHQVANVVADAEGLDMWLDVGDFLDMASFSKFAPQTVDAPVICLNSAIQRGSEELALRRQVVGENGSVVVLDANHTIRMRAKTMALMPWMVGLRRAGEPEEHPVLSVPFLVRARDYNVEWAPVWPSGYRMFNSNFVAVHSPVYGSKQLQTAEKLASRLHASVVFGHIHRREQLAAKIHIPGKGERSLEIFSDGCWARTDGALPSAENTYDDCGDRMTQTDNTTAVVGYLGEQMDQGFTIAHIERGGRERFSLERVILWDGWAQFRGHTFQASVDVDGCSL